jgi:dolichol kinase
MTEFVQDALGQASVWVITSLLALYAIETAWFTRGGFMAALEDRWSALGATFAMFALTILVAWRGEVLFPNPMGPFVAVLGLVALVNSYTFTLGRYQEKIDKFVAEFGARMEPLLADLVPEERLAAFKRMRINDPEQRRKAPHMMMAVFLIFYLVAGYLFFHGLAAIMPAGIVHDNLLVAANYGWLGAGHVFSMMLLIGLLLILAPTEMVRLRFPELSYPFKSLIEPNLRRKEAGLFGAHYYIVIALAIMAITLTYDASTWSERVPMVLAAYAVTIFADTASALIGKPFGKRKWFHNHDKSYLGTLAGFIVAVAVALPFLSVPWAIGCGLVFVLVDVIGPVPVPISDNIMNPLALGALLFFA